jgi:hypothetical protein
MTDTKNKTLVDLDWLTMVEKRQREIDALELEDIVWVRNGRVVTLDPEFARNYKFMGLGNSYLATLSEQLAHQGETIWVESDDTKAVADAVVADKK